MSNKQKLKIVIIANCLKYLPKSLRNIVGDFLSYEVRVKLKSYLCIQEPIKPILTVENMFRNKIYFCKDQPNSKTIYIPYRPGWILTSGMLLLITYRTTPKQIFWECPTCKIWKPLLVYLIDGPRLKIYEVSFEDGLLYFTCCLGNMKEIYETHLELDTRHDRTLSKLTIAERKLKLDDLESETALNNTYSNDDLLERYNADGGEY